ncbi:MAG TPA: heavy metal-binding domain-containing protein [Oligoflexia bacterium]|nr:heavy metal-binding domain-containing protein [Oligoflexia bacterium]
MNQKITGSYIQLAAYFGLFIMLAAGYLVVYPSVSVWADEAGGKEQILQYTCPMPEHADVVSEKPGQCPKCGMNMVVRAEPENAKEKKHSAHGEGASDKCETKNEKSECAAHASCRH